MSWPSRADFCYWIGSWPQIKVLTQVSLDLDRLSVEGNVLEAEDDVNGLLVGEGDETEPEIVQVNPNCFATFLNLALMSECGCQMARLGFFPNSYAVACFKPTSASPVGQDWDL